MLGYTEFHHDLIRKYITLFGSLFADIEVYRQGAENELVKVPLNFSSVNKVLAFAEKQHGSDQMAIATITPRIAFDLVNVRIDHNRKFNKFQTVALQQGSIRVPQPYTFTFSVNVMTKTETEATRIVEQIVPHFDPSISLTMFPIAGDTAVSHDIKVSLLDVGRNNEYQGMAEQRQTIVWTLMFELQGWLYGPKQSGSSIIKKININFLDELGTTTIQPGMTFEGTPTTDIGQSIPYTDIDQDDDWSFIVNHGA